MCGLIGVMDETGPVGEPETSEVVKPEEYTGDIPHDLRVLSDRMQARYSRLQETVEKGLRQELLFFDIIVSEPLEYLKWRIKRSQELAASKVDLGETQETPLLKTPSQ